VGAALQAGLEGVPAIAASVGVDLAEARSAPRFPSTLEAFAPAADFVARLVARLQEGAGQGRLLPEGLVLNVNVPVPYARVRGVEITRLAARGRLDFVWRDARGVVARGGGPMQIALVPEKAEPAPGTDAAAFRAGRISITPLDADMTAGPAPAALLEVRLGGLVP
jgi:5'/3'-nucleotidase SurE